MKNSILSKKMLDFLINKFNIKNLDDLNGVIEEALMEYYNISLLDLENIKIDVEEMTFENYVYIYMDPRIYNKEGWKLYENKYCFFLPFYIGKGRGNRNKSHLIYTKNGKMEKKLNELKKENIEPKIEIISNGLSNLMAHNLENNIINSLRDQNVSLCNLTQGYNIDKNDCIITEINLEGQKNLLVLETLNSSKTIIEAAKKLGTTERNLYRKIKNLNIIREKLGVKKYLYKIQK